MMDKKGNQRRIAPGIQLVSIPTITAEVRQIPKAIRRLDKALAAIVRGKTNRQTNPAVIGSDENAYLN